LYREFVWLLLIAFFIAVPVSWIAMYKWLQDYAFRIDLHWAYFAIPFVGIIAIALITVSFQSLRAAVANPVNSLRSE
jgi:putative ABC transport system permease protein